MSDWMYEWIHERTNEPSNERTNERSNKRTNKRTNRQTNERTNKQTTECTNEWTNKRMHARTYAHTQKRMHACMMNEWIQIYIFDMIMASPGYVIATNVYALLCSHQFTVSSKIYWTYWWVYINLWKKNNKGIMKYWYIWMDCIDTKIA